MFVLNGILLICISLAPTSISIPTRYRWDEFQDVGGRIGDLERTLASEDAVEGGKIGWIIGTSSTRAGFSSRVLEAEDGMNIRWLVLVGGGPNFADLQYLLAPLRLMQRKPDVIVLATHRSLLVNRLWRSIAGFTARTSIWHALRLAHQNFLNEMMEWWRNSRHKSPPILESIAESITPLRESLKSNNAFSTLSVVTRLYLRHEFYGFRFRLFTLFAQNSTGLFPLKRYRTELPSKTNFAIPPNEWMQDSGLFFNAPKEFYRNHGALEPANYSSDEYGARTLADLLQFLADFGAPVYVVLMPERSDLHGVFPREADVLLDSIVRRCASPFAIGRLDVTTLMEDSYFYLDAVHLSRPVGQELFSRRFARIIASELRDRHHWSSTADADSTRSSERSKALHN